MAPTMPTLLNAALDRDVVATELTFQTARLRDIGNSEKLIDLEFAVVTTNAGSGAPAALPLTTDPTDPQHIPPDADRLTLRCDGSNSNGATTGTIRIRVTGPGGTDTATAAIVAGDTSPTAKEATVTLSAGNIDADCTIVLDLWRDTGVGNVRAEGPGLISNTWNSEI